MELNFAKLFGIFEKKEHKYKNALFEPYGLKSMHYGYLRIISMEPGISQDGIAAKVYSDKANVARQIAHLEKKGYVIRKVCKDDARKSEVYLSEKGEETFKEMRKLLNQFNKRLAKGLSKEDVENFNRILNHMTENIEEMEQEL